MEGATTRRQSSVERERQRERIVLIKLCQKIVGVYLFGTQCTYRTVVVSEKGFCVRGDLCEFDHGVDPVVIDNVLPGQPLPPQSLSRYPLPGQPLAGQPPSTVAAPMPPVTQMLSG